jgi:5-methylcytosine-specific restriction endonuclease McrA
MRIGKKVGHRDLIDRNDEVQPIAKRSGQSAVIASDLRRSASTLARRVTGVSAWAGIHRRYEQESGRKYRDPCRARDADDTFLERLPQSLQGTSIEFGNLIEKKYSVVGQTRFARSGLSPPTDESRVRNRVMGCSKRTGVRESLASSLATEY